MAVIMKITVLLDVTPYSSHLRDNKCKQQVSPERR
jgi:hypothetical protein